MTDQLSLYNGALMLCGERLLASVSENRKPRRLLDQTWDTEAVKYCLSRGMWTWAKHTIKVDYDPSLEPNFGYKRAFRKPTDYVRTASFCSDEYFRCPINNYADEVDFWWCDDTTVYIQYVSDDPAYGLNYAAWPPAFTNFVQAYLASKIVFSLTQSENKQQAIEIQLKRCLKTIQAEDGTNQPAKFLPRGTWSRARRGGNSPRNPNYDISGAQ